MDPLSFVFGLMVVGVVGGSLYHSHVSGPRHALKQVARRRNWAFQQDHEVHVRVPTPAGEVVLASWSDPTAVDGGKRGWAATTPVVLPETFVRRHRVLLSQFVNETVAFGSGELKLLPMGIRLETTRTAVAGEVAQAVEGAIYAARTLDAGHTDPLRAVRHLANAPPDIDMAWAVLDWSLTHDKESPHLPQLIAWGLESDNPRYRLTAARAIQDERAVEPLLELIGSGRYGDATRVDALEVLIGHPAWRQQSTVARDRVAAMLIGLLPKVSGNLLAQVLLALDDHFDVPVAPQLLGDRLQAVGTKARVALVKAMYRHGAAAERELIAALKDDKRAVRIVAARGLRDHGTLRSLSALQQVAERWTTVASEQVTVNEAIAAIAARYRHELRSAGGLALSEAVERGGLSEAEQQVGELELAP